MSFQTATAVNEHSAAAVFEADKNELVFSFQQFNCASVNDQGQDFHAQLTTQAIEVGCDVLVFIKFEMRLVFSNLFVVFQIEEMDLDWIKKEIIETSETEPHSTVAACIPAKGHLSIRRSIKSVSDLSFFLHKCEEGPLSHRKLKSGSPCCLVECPACFIAYKNSPDRLIRLFNHVNKRHMKSRDRILRDILKDYYPLIRFMKKYLKFKS